MKMKGIDYSNTLLLISRKELQDGSYASLITEALKRLGATDSNSDSNSSTETKLSILLLHNINRFNSIQRLLLEFYDYSRAQKLKLGISNVKVYVLYNENYIHLKDSYKFTAILKSVDCDAHSFGNKWDVPVYQIPIDASSIHADHKIELVDDEGTSCEGRYKTVAVGGTFDHIHDGHKILLTISGFLTRDHLIVGVTGKELLKNKKYADFLEDFETRSESVHDFFNIVNPQLDYKIYEINDVCGPTGTIDDIDALVLSSETVSGGEYVNNFRKEKGFRELIIEEVDIVGGGTKEDGWKDKLSSTYYRKLEYEKSKP